ncbi:hypothetical protein FRC08_014999 [Ceratobasidium sp. 394]|nr:hypothetical protein FRC08_014999 [Ceratobasidium sp. 394]
MHRLFKTQELVTAICASLHAKCLLEWGTDGPSSYNLKKFRRTALVSTHFFYGILPHIWKSIDMLSLFYRKLIPREATLKWPPGHTADPLSRKAMSRFHVYAPYIRTLRAPSAHLQNWEPLIAYSKDNELLPNLIEFECDGSGPEALSVFLPRSTRKVTIVRPYPKPHPIADTRQILEHAVHKCPGLYSLEFHPMSTTDADTSVEVLLSFKRLGHLVSTPIVLQSTGLQTVARLPRLNTLSIKPAGSGHWDSSLCEQMPADSFPVLSDLTLCLEKPRDATQFWVLIPLRMLKKLDLTITAPHGDNSEFISTLCRTSPQITELALRFPESERCYRWTYRISAEVFEHLARLPIESCLFESATFDFEGSWAKIGGSWPNLRFLECLSQPADLEDLLVLSSSLPRLESVGCQFDLERAARTVGANWSPVGRPPFYPSLLKLVSPRTNMMKIAYGPELRGLARFFAYFWPNLSVKSVEPYYISDDPRWDFSQLLAELSARRDALFGVFRELILAYVELYHKV